MAVMLCASSMVVKVPDLRMYWSTPTKATVFPHGTSAICSTVRPIMRTVRWTFLTLRDALWSKLLHSASHHENCALDILDIEVFL